MVSASIHNFRASVKSDPPTGILLVCGYIIQALPLETILEDIETVFIETAQRTRPDIHKKHSGLALLGTIIYLLRSMKAPFSSKVQTIPSARSVLAALPESQRQETI